MALIAPHFMDSVVALGSIRNGTKKWIGTGFIFGNLKKETDDGTNTYMVYLITNKHVIDNVDNILVRFNSQTNITAKDYQLNLKDSSGKLLWIGHPDKDVDVAVTSLDVIKIRKEGMKCTFFESDKHTFTKTQMLANGSTEGDFVFAMGYPMGIVNQNRQHVFVRSGIISRIQDLYESKSKDFVIDSFVFPGNSGGPVLLKPELSRIKGTERNNSSSLIGIVKSYIPYIDIAISQQTGNPRITFEENTGLTLVEPVDHIIETIQEFEKLILNNT